MKINKVFLFIVIGVIIFLSVDAFARKKRKEYFTRPQVGAWFGPITPLGKTAELVETALGGGVFARINTPYRFIKIGLDASYQKYESKGVNELTFVPAYFSLIYLLPIDLPVRFQLKGGLGVGYLYLLPDKKDQWDPVFTVGLEISFPAGRIVNIGLRMDYIYIFERYKKNSESEGHILNIGVMVYFNI